MTCGACSARLDAVGDVTVLTDEARLVGGCCAGFRQHLVRWRARDGFEGETAFETWPQDCVRLSRGDRVSLLFPAGRAEPRGRRARPPMPLMVADHTTGTIWSLVGSVPVRTLRDPG